MKNFEELSKVESVFKNLFKNNFIHISDTDLDGVMCTVITKFYFGDKIQTFNCPVQELYNFINKQIDYGNIKEGDNLLLTDLSLRKEEKDELKNKNITVYTIDHHASTEKDENTYLDIKNSACYNYFLFFNIKCNDELRKIFHFKDDENIDCILNKNMTKFVSKYRPFMCDYGQLINYDDYDFTPEISQAINMTIAAVNASDIFLNKQSCFEIGRYLNSMMLKNGMTPEENVLILMSYIDILNNLYDIYNSNELYLNDLNITEQAFHLAVRVVLQNKLYGIVDYIEYHKLKSKHELELKLSIKNLNYIKTSIDNLNIMFMDINDKFSDISFHILNEENKENADVEGIDIIISYTKHGTITMRSKVDGYDVSKLASKHGGGGHKAAAGIPIKLIFSNLEEFKNKVTELIKNDL